MKRIYSTNVNCINYGRPKLYILIEFCLLALSVIERGVKIYNLGHVYFSVFVRVCFWYFKALLTRYIQFVMP